MSSELLEWLTTYLDVISDGSLDHLNDEPLQNKVKKNFVYQI